MDIHGHLHHHHIFSWFRVWVLASGLFQDDNPRKSGFMHEEYHWFGNTTDKQLF